MTVNPLPAESLRRRCDADAFSFETTADLPDLDVFPGQERAREALAFGLGMPHEGYNLFALGPEGVGRHQLVLGMVGEVAAERAIPDDWCYVNDFEHPVAPIALRLPPGQGPVLRDDLARLVEDLAVEIAAAFEAEDYRARRKTLQDELQHASEEEFAALTAEAERRRLALVGGPGALALVPVRDGAPMPPDQVEKLPEEEREAIEKDSNTMKERFQEFLEGLPKRHHDLHEKIRALDREVTGRAVGHLVDRLQEKWAAQEAVVGWLDAVERDVLANAQRFVGDEQGANPLLQALSGEGVPRDQDRRYAVNVLVTHEDGDGAPVVYEDDPDLAALAGRIDHRVHLGALVTDFTQIRAGALHKANGGFLVLDALRVLRQPLSWHYLERALRSREIRLESAAEVLGIASTASLEPEPIPLDVKVVLVGSPLVYYTLCKVDPEFPALFKVAADFDDRIPRTPEHEEIVARLVATMARHRELCPFDREAVARIVEHAARTVGDADRLTTHLQTLDDLLRESDYVAREAGHDTVTGNDVVVALEGLRRREGRLRDRSLEALVRDLVHVEVQGQSVGQVNGLMVLDLGPVRFGRPGRITAQVRLGGGEVLDIEREVDLGGPIHSKGVLILTGFVGGRYVPDQPLALHASLVFEQSYGHVEGDSASLAETCALLSAIGEIPVSQGIAVTGAIDQHGRVMAVGGVNEKVEGFFEVCAARGLTGDQGVIVPTVTVPFLMLRDEVVEAAEAGRFHVWAVDDVDEAMALLSGLEPGARGEDGTWPEGTINRRVEDRLKELAERAAELRRNHPARTAG